MKTKGGGEKKANPRTNLTIIDRIVSIRIQTDVRREGGLLLLNLQPQHYPYTNLAATTKQTKLPTKAGAL